MNRFKNLEIWKRAIKLTTKIYTVTSGFPDGEKYGLTSQIRRCAVSIGSNIAEGAGRNSEKEFKHFLNMAYGSSCELETQLIIAQNLKYLDREIGGEFIDDVGQLQKMMYAFSKKLTQDS